LDITQEDIDAVSIKSFKNKLEKKRTCQMDFFKDKVYKSYRLHDQRSYGKVLAMVLEKKRSRKDYAIQVQPHPVSYPVSYTSGTARDRLV